MSQAELARKLCTITDTCSLTRHEVGRWEQGRVRPVTWLPALAQVLNVDLVVLENAPPRESPAAPGQVNELPRRTFREQGAVAALGLEPDHHVIQALDVAASDSLPRLVDVVGELVDHYALTLNALPPEKVYREILAIRAYVSGVVESVRSAAQHDDLALTSGRLSHLLAVAASDMGAHSTARVWCSDAERRSHEVGHPELAAWAILTRAHIAFYHDQPYQSASLAAEGRAKASMGTVIHAKLAAQEMRAAAMAGDAGHLARARCQADKAVRALSGDVPSTGVFSIAVADDPPYTATSLLLAGRFREAVFATDRVIQTLYQPTTRQRGEQPSSYARCLLILALAHAGDGNLDESVAAGHAALSGKRPAWPTLVLAKKLDQVLQDRFQGARQTDAYHAHYGEAARALSN